MTSFQKNQRKGNNPMSNPQNPANPNREYFQVGIALQDLAGRFLLIQEAATAQPDDAHQGDVTQPNAEATAGKWKLPYDHLHAQDDRPSHLPSAASVIGTHLTAYDFDTHDICYIGLHEGPCVVIIYAADQPYDLSITDTPDPEKVAAVGWFTADEILQLSEKGLLRDPEITLTVIENTWTGLSVPEEVITVSAPE